MPTNLPPLGFYGLFMILRLQETKDPPPLRQREACVQGTYWTTRPRPTSWKSLASTSLGCQRHLDASSTCCLLSSTLSVFSVIHTHPAWPGRLRFPSLAGLSRGKACHQTRSISRVVHCGSPHLPTHTHMGDPQVC